MTGPRPAPATSRDPDGLVLLVLAAMSTDERVTIRLRDGTTHVGQITRRTTGGLMLDTGGHGRVGRGVRDQRRPSQAPKRDKRDRRLARTRSATAAAA